MSSSNHTLPSPSISDVMNLLCTMKKENDEAMKEILTKLTRIEDDNRKLKQELHEIKSSIKHNNNNSKLSSRKRDEPEYDDEAENRNEQSNSNKRARVSVSTPSLPDLELGPASFNTLDDDCLGNVLEFVGKKCYSVFGRVNKRCHEMFCSKGLPKETYLFGYAPLDLIRQQPEEAGYYEGGYSKGVFHYNRRDILEWILAGGRYSNYLVLGMICNDAIKESRLDILREVFQRADEWQLRRRLKVCLPGTDLCGTAAYSGKLECMKFLRENGCEWNKWTWWGAKDEGHEHILDHLQNNGFPTEWQVDSESECDY